MTSSFQGYRHQSLQLDTFRFLANNARIPACEFKDKLFERAAAAPDGNSNSERTDIVFVSAPEREAFTEILQHPVAAIVEIQNGSDQDIVRRLITPPCSNGVYIDLTTASALNVELSHSLTTHLARWWHADDEAEFAMTTATHEAVGNALLHGNLGVGSIPEGADLDTFHEISAETEARLQDQSLADRRIMISASWDNKKLTVFVVNEGDGFDYVKHLRERTTSRTPHRGLGLIQELADSCRFSDEGRCILLEFARTKMNRDSAGLAC